MTNVECRKKPEIRSSNSAVRRTTLEIELRHSFGFRHSSFGFLSDFVIRISSLATHETRNRHRSRDLEQKLAPARRWPLAHRFPFYSRTLSARHGRTTRFEQRAEPGGVRRSWGRSGANDWLCRRTRGRFAIRSAHAG